MTTITQAKEILYAAFVAGWGTTTPYQLDNEDGTDSLNEDPANGDVSWVRVVVRNETFGQKTLGQKGNRKFTREGRLLIQVFTLANTGTKDSDVLSQKLVDMFEGEKFSGVWVNELTPRGIGNDGKWYQALCDGTFEYEEVK